MHWIYKKDVTEEKIKQLKNKTEILKGIEIPVYCLELDTEYPSATKAGEILHLDPSSIRKTTKGKQKTCGGYHWKSLQKKINIGQFN